MMLNVCLLLWAMCSIAIAAPPYLPETGILAGSYSAPFDGVSGSFVQYYSFGSSSWRQDITVNGRNETVLYTSNTYFLFDESSSLCQAYTGYEYPLPPLALEGFTYFGTEILNYTTTVDHYAGVLRAAPNGGRSSHPNTLLYVSAYFDPSSMQPVRLINYAALPDHSSEIFDYNIWVYVAPESFVFQPPPQCTHASDSIVELP